MKIKTLLLIFLSFTLVFMLTACGGSVSDFAPLTPAVKTVRLDLGMEADFTDFNGKDFLISRSVINLGDGGETPPDALFLLDSESGKAAQLGFFKPDVHFYGENYCYFAASGENELTVVSADPSGAETLLFTVPETAYQSCLYRSGEYLIVVSFGDGELYAVFYNVESGKTTYAERSGDIVYTGLSPINGFISYTERLPDGSAVMAIDPKKPDKEIKASETLSTKVISSAFDGTTFVWSTYQGLFACEKGGEPVAVANEKVSGFGFIGGRYVIYSAAEGESTVLHDLAEGSSTELLSGGHSVIYFSGEEHAAVLEPKGSEPGSEYVIVTFSEAEK